MSEEEKNTGTNLLSDTESHEKEVNTYDSPPLSKADTKEKSTLSYIVKRIYSFAAILTVFLAVVFSSAEICDFVFNDMGTGNIIMKRIFKSDLMGQGLSLCELIIKNSFIVPYEQPSSQPLPATKEDPPLQSVPPETTPAQPNETTSPAPPSSDAKEPGENEFPILQTDMSLLSYGKYYIYNNTSLSPDVEALASSALKSYYQADAPLVLVIHTHGTESYMPDGAKYYSDDGEIARSQDINENMIAVGKEFVRVLEENGVPTLHCTIMHDKESYRDSYSRAEETIKKYLEEYPSIKYVFDLHRDSVMKSTGELISAVASIDGESCAQIMAVVGSGYEDWESNLIFALKLREELNSEHTNLCRPACLRESTYNQDMAAVSVLLEIGTSGNTLSEAKRAAALTANAIAQMIKNG